MTRFIVTIIITSSLLVSESAIASPNISSATGKISNGAVITITGKSFGAKINATPLKWDNFESASIGETWIEHDSYWMEGNNSPMLISLDNSRIGNNVKAILKATDPSDQASMVWRDNVGFADTGKIYLNFWLRMDFGTALTSGYFQVKNIEIAVASSKWGNGNFIMPMLSINHFVYPGHPAYTQCLLGNYRSSVSVLGNLATGSSVINGVNFQGYTIATGMSVSGSGIQSGTTIIGFDENSITLSKSTTTSATNVNITVFAPSDPTIYFPNNTFARFTPTWQNVAMQVDMGDPGVPNSSKWYWASEPNLSTPYVHVGADNRTILDAIAGKLNAIKFGWYRSGYVAGHIASGTSIVQYDDIYIDNSWARVELGDAPIYENCAHREIQIPTAWSTNSISLTVNQGSFTTGQTAYLFVIDENGVASNGYSISLQNKNTPTPAAPGNLLIRN